MRVLVVDDSAFMRRAITRMLEKAPEIEVVGAARNGREGLEMAQRLKPDVVTLDIEMPEMDGLTALRHIMRQCPTPVLMLSSLTTEGSHAALRALKIGAADVLAKDTSQFSLSITAIEQELLSKVRALGQIRRRTAPAVHVEEKLPAFHARQFDVVCIGSSTGGPPVLETLLAGLPAALRTPIVIAQHMPALFTASMADRLNQRCALPVIHAADDQPLLAGHVYIAPGGRHLHLTRAGLGRWALRVSDQPADALYRPSVDALFRSAAETTRARTLAILLTGMGCDGLAGAQQLHQQGGILLAQSEETCIVYGMPKGVTEQGLASASLAPKSIARLLASLADPAPSLSPGGH